MLCSRQLVAIPEIDSGPKIDSGTSKIDSGTCANIFQCSLNYNVSKNILNVLSQPHEGQIGASACPVVHH
jgi:hypothetical protein